MYVPRLVYAPMPLQAAFEFALPQFATRDARFARLVGEGDRAQVESTVQDSADLLNAHLTLQLDGMVIEGVPGRWDEVSGASHPWVGVTEAELLRVLRIDEGSCGAGERVDGLPSLRQWRAGVAVTLHACPARGGMRVRRRLNLANFFDRLEFAFLLDVPSEQGCALRAWQLDEQGGLRHWRGEVTLLDSPV